MNVYEKAAQWIAGADALVITAGAGMGVDSGLPDFRGDSGFWKAYPALHGTSFVSMANPRWFDSDPHRAWGFYGHRLNLYRSVTPHDGFDILRQWSIEKEQSGLCLYFKCRWSVSKSGFSSEQMLECHGSIHHVQDLEGVDGIWAADEIVVDVDEVALQARDPLPRHPTSQAVIRPNMSHVWRWLLESGSNQRTGGSVHCMAQCPSK